MLLTVALAGCESTQQALTRGLGSGPTLEARLVPSGGSAATGAAMLRGQNGGVTMSLSFRGVPAGPYRVVVHANGNCTSANGFSAGPPWAPPGVATANTVLMKSDDTALLVVRLPGYRIDGPDGLLGRAVVIHAGSQGPLEAEPGVPNDRIACGAIGAARQLLAPQT